MDEETEFTKLPVEERCVHKLWKARVSGYEDAAKLFQQQTDEKSPEFNKYLGLVKKFVIDSNAAAQEKGLAAALAYVENAAGAGKTCGEVMNGVITKCYGASRTRTKELAIELTLMYIEIEKHEAVQDELIKGLDNKTPKIVTICVTVLKDSLRLFGSKVVAIKPLVKVIPKMLEDRDKNVREETKLLAVEVYRWIKDAIKPQLQSLKPVQLSELEAEFAKMSNEKAVPLRYLRSQQAALAKTEAAANEAEVENDDEAAPEAEVIDPYEFMDPVDVLAKLPKDFYEKCEAKKWQERKDALEAVQQLACSPKLENGDYGDLVRVLKRMVSKDSNVLCVALAAKCLAGLAIGLRKRFHPYASNVIPTILEKFKEKKMAVVTALREAIDASYAATNLEAILEDVQAALDNKNPQIKAETAAFLTRCFLKMTPQILTKKLLKPLCTSFMKTLNESDPIVRDNTSEALGTAMKLVSEKIITPFLQDIDPLKMAKIKEFCDKAEIVATPAHKSGKAKIVKPSSTKPVTVISPAVSEENVTSTTRAISAPAGPPKKVAVFNKPRPSTAVKPSQRIPGKKPTKVQTTEAPKKAEFSERELTDEEVSEQAEETFTADVINGLTSANWKDRLASIEKFNEIVQAMPKETIPAQLLVKLLARKPGFKDNNFQVLKLRLDVLTYIVVDNSSISRCTFSVCMSDLVDKIGDPKTGCAAMAAITAFAEAISLETVSMEVLQVAFAQKNPKNQSESLNWLGNAIKEFGFKINVKFVVDNIKKSLAATNPAIRTAAVSLLGVMYMYMGKPLRTLFDDEKPALLQQIDAELAKVEDSKPPIPTRGAAKKSTEDSENGEGGDAEMDLPTINMEDLVPRSDISGQLTETLLAELEDKNWKVRAEALTKVASIIDDAKFISSNIGDLAASLKSRLNDSNKNLAVQALNICQNLSNALGPYCKGHVRSVAPGLLSAIGDNKTHVRAAAISCLNCWLDNSSLPCFFESEMISDALKTENPLLRIELFGWLAEKLPTVDKLPASELILCLPHLYSCLEDRNAEVRKKAQDCLLPFMVLLSYEQMSRAAGKLKPASKATVAAMLEKTRPNLPARAPPVPKAKPAGAQQTQMAPSANVPQEDGTKMKMTRSSSRTKIAGKSGISAPSAGAKGNKKEEDVDTSPGLVANNMKDSRILDEKNLRVLRWNFTTPREEFYQLCKEQMTSANWSKTLISYCFHNDFKFHLKALDNLTECLNVNLDATIANTDLILKWLALRFFDTNPSVLIKGLEYLQQLFPSIHSQGYKLNDYEASSFIPYLILKIGDPKDSVRKGVRDILQHIFHIYPASKVFGHVMQGLASKNARQRTECLEVLSFMFEMFGVGVCQPSPSVSLKEVAKLISDRDNGVRTAALNCVVTVYHIEGEKVYKYIGNLNDKEASLLEERIKRSTKKPSPQPVISTQTFTRETRNPHGAGPLAPMTRASPAVQSATQEQQEPVMRPTGRSRNAPRPLSTGQFKLDDDMNQMFNRPKESERMLPKPVAVDANEILNLPDIELPKTRMRPAASAVKMLNSSSEANMALNLVMAQLTSQDISVVVEAFMQLEEVLRQEDKAEMALTNRVDQLLLMGAVQYRLAYHKHMADETMCKADVVKLFRCVTLTLTALFDHPKLSKLASRDVIRDLIPHLVTVILDTRLNELQEGPLVVRSINVLVIRILQKANPTYAMSALIKLLHDCVGNNTASERYTELIMKCLWKMLRMIQHHINELNLDRILFDTHVFLKTYPSAFWKERRSDTPLRTIKTVLYHLVKHKKEEILKHLVLIPDKKESDLVVYLQKMLNVEKGDSPALHHHKSNRSGNANAFGTPESARADHLTGSGQKQNKHSPMRLSKSTHDTLAEIFKKIGDKEHTKEGLLELYEFRKQHPEADIEPFLQRSSDFFQNYIRRGLNNIRDERNGKTPPAKETLKTEEMASRMNRGLASSVESCLQEGAQIPPVDSSPLDYLEYLKVIAAQLQLDGSKYSDPPFTQKFLNEIKSASFEEVDHQKDLESDRQIFEELKKMYEQDMGLATSH